MSSFYRSDTVNHYKLILPRQSAWDIMNKLGQVKLIHVVQNSMPLLSKPFFTQVKRCEEGLQRLSTLEKIIHDRDLAPPDVEFSQQAFQELYKTWEIQSTKTQKNPISMLDGFQENVDQLWDYHNDLQKRVEELSKKLNFYRQNLAIIRGGQKEFGRAFFTNSQNRVDELGQLFMRDVTRVNFKTGVINAEDEIRFKKTVFRITKGNCLINCVHFDDIFDHTLEAEKTKMAFFVLYPAKEQNYFDKKITKLVQTYCDTVYDLPSKQEDFEPKIRALQDGYVETQKLLSLTESEIEQFFTKLSSPAQQSKIFRKYEYLRLYLIKEKEIYAQLNEMELYNNFLKGQIYIRKEDVPDLQRLFQNIEQIMKIPSGQIVAVDTNKFPTNYTLNSFTCSAQEIVGTYGCPRYKEANPSFFTTVTFPFLFGVMFGDIAHGSILFSFGIYLCFWGDTIKSGPLKLVVPHRYLFTLMGFFATYCGFIYNDFLSISLNLWGSCYDPNDILPKHIIPRSDTECVYGLGLDPVWAVASNNLNFVNSMKMKISVIIAVVHMTLGVFIKAGNSLYFKRYIQFIFEFLPQLCFMVVLFGYMDFLIIYKWLKPWDSAAAIQASPSIITTMINLPLKLGKTQDCCGGQPLWGTPGNTSQDQIQLILLMIAAISVPLMLLVKPIYEICCKDHGPKKAGMQRVSSGAESKKLIESSQFLDNEDKGEIPEEEQEHDASEIFVHQMIETIEYVLGCISNTASYLRLWALSLAHSQLSEVFLEKTVEGGIAKGYSGIFVMILFFPVLAGATFGVLLCMDVMQCFLHTLRLHWVEFQNKFYKGDGFLFVFYSFSDRIRAQLAADSL